MKYTTTTSLFFYLFICLDFVACKPTLDSVKTQNITTKIVAHRGAWKNNNLPENSIASLKAAAEGGFWGSEFDVHLTKDNKLVVNHDNDFKGINIPNSTYDELLVKKHKNGENIPKLKDYLAEGKKHKNLKLILEIKTNPNGLERTLESTERIYNMVKKHELLDQVQFIAFSYDACLKLRELDKTTVIQYLNGDKSPKEIKEANISGLDYHMSVFRNNPSWIDIANKMGLITNVWTVNDINDMEEFISQGADFITTNEPEILQKILNQ